MDKVKAKIRIPKDQYAFIELDVEDTVDNIQILYQTLIKADVGLPDKEWRDALDKYITTNSLESHEYEAMSVRQKDIIQEIKRSIKRIEYKNK